MIRQPIFVTLKSTGQKFRVLPTLEDINSDYVTLIWPHNNTKQTYELRRVRRSKVRFDSKQVNQFVAWETAVLRDNTRMKNWVNTTNKPTTPLVQVA